MDTKEMTVEELNHKLRTEPMFLVQIIAKNNPADVSAGLSSIGHATGELPPADILQILTEIAPDIDNESLVQILSVDFNPDTDDPSATYLPALQVAQEQMRQAGHIVGLNWGKLYPDSLKSYQAAITDFTGTTPKKSHTTPPRAAARGCGCGCGKHEKAFKIAAAVFFLLLIAIIIKYW